MPRHSSKAYRRSAKFTMAPYLDPVNQTFVNDFAAEGIPPLQDIPIPELRKLVDQLQKHTPIPGVTETSFKVPFEGRHVEAFLFKPEGAEGPLPTILYLHGGGWVFGKYVVVLPFFYVQEN